MNKAIGCNSMAIEGDIGLLKWAWGVVVLPFAWVVSYIKTTRSKVDILEIRAARLMTREDVEHMIDRNNQPIKDKLDIISDTLEHMRRNS